MCPTSCRSLFAQAWLGPGTSPMPIHSPPTSADSSTLTPRLPSLHLPETRHIHLFCPALPGPLSVSVHPLSFSFKILLLTVFRACLAAASPGLMSLDQCQLPRLASPPPSLPLLSQPLREGGWVANGPRLMCWNAVLRLVLRLCLGSAYTSAMFDEQVEEEGSAGLDGHPDPHFFPVES